MSKFNWKVLLTQTFIVILFIFIWELGSRIGFINEFIFSSPSSIIKTLYKLIISGDLFTHLLSTSKEILIAFSIGALIGFVMSIILYLCPFLAKVIDPF